MKLVLSQQGASMHVANEMTEAVKPLLIGGALLPTILLMSYGLSRANDGAKWLCKKIVR